MLGFAGLSIQGIIAVFVHSLPAQGGKRLHDGVTDHALLLTTGVFNGRRACQASHRFDADHRLVALKMDPVAPVLGFVLRL